MQLRDFRINAFKEYEDFRIEDVSFFLTIRNRAIESTDIMICFFAMSQGQRTIDTSLVIRALLYVDSNAEYAVREGSTQAVISPRHVRDFARAPEYLEHTEEAIEAIAHYLSFYLVKIFREGAAAASRDPSFRRDSPVIKLTHLLSSCDDLPYPLNLWLC
jgi:hypothetical protein